MTIYDLDTPALVCDLEVLDRNLTTMQAHCDRLGIGLRPHLKTHKVPEIARQQVSLGAIGVCCQKLSEAEVMSAAGLDNILILYNIVGPSKVKRLIHIVKTSTITVACDSEETAMGISEVAKHEGVKVRIIIELDCNTGRCGVQSPQAALSLAQKMARMGGLDLQGIMTFPSYIESKPFIEETVSLLTGAGFPVSIISGGSTGLEECSKEIGCNEHRSGSYAFEGMTRIRGSDTLTPERCPLRMICTVVSTPTPERVIIDGGAKTFASHAPTPYGLILEHPDAKLRGMSVEHGHIDVSECANRFRVGERVSVIPLHGGMTTNLHDTMYGARGDSVETVWGIPARGKVQ